MPLFVMNLAAYFAPWGAMEAAAIGDSKNGNLCFHEWCMEPATKHHTYMGGFLGGIAACDEHAKNAPGSLVRSKNVKKIGLSLHYAIVWIVIVFHGLIGLVALGEEERKDPKKVAGADFSRRGWTAAESVGLVVVPRMTCN